MGWKEESNRKVQDKQQGNKFKLAEGKNIFRILPNIKALKKDDYDTYRPYQDFLVHRNVGPKKLMATCGKDVDTKKGECWLCDEIIEPYSKSNKASRRAVAKALDPIEQTMMQVARWDKATETLRGPYKFFVPGGGGPNSTAVKLVGLISGSSRHYDHPKKGYNISISRTGTGPTDTRYSPPEPDEYRSEVPKGILRKIEAFDDLIPAYDEDIQRALFFGEEIEARRKSNHIKEEEDDDMPKKKRKDEDEETVTKKKKKGKKVEDDDEDEDEEEEEEDDEDDKKSKKKKKSKKDDDDDEEEEDDDEDEDDDDDDDDEPVKKKAKKKKSKKDDDDEEEDDDEDEDDDDEPVKKKKKKKSKKDDDDDEEEEDDDDDEEEEDDDEDEDDEPVKKKKKKKK